MSDELLATRDGSVLLLTLNRPERLNAWTYELGDEYFAALDAADDDPGIRAVVVTGAGRGFCAGMDSSVLDNVSGGGAGKMPAGGRSMTHAADFRKPLIGAINGACVGFGLVQALAFDLRFAGMSASFATAFTRRGLNAEYGTSYLLPRIVGHARAMDWLLSGRVFDAHEAAASGLVATVVPDDELLAHSMRYAHMLADSCSPTAMADVKQQVNQSWSQERTVAESEAKRLGHLPGHRDDFAEGVRSFVERRTPQFAPLAPRSPSMPV